MRIPPEPTAARELTAARAVLEQEQGLLAREFVDELDSRVKAWQGEGIDLVTEDDPAYPRNLRAIADRPRLIFVSGQLRPDDTRSVAVIGSRKPTPDGEALAREIAHDLVDNGYTVNSGLAAGIDTAAHEAALARGGRTVAVIGTGLRHCYPARNAKLQHRISGQGAVVSQFWPDTPPRPEHFRIRNGVMAGLSLATVIVEASVRSGARIQARLSLAQRRPVILADGLLSQQWARELAERSGVYVIGSPSDVRAMVERRATDSAIA